MSRHYITALILCLLPTCEICEMFAQSPLTEKRIYLVDLTGSMEGRGNVPTPNILQTVKDNLEETISNIEDTATEIQIVPFTNKIGKDIISGRISEKEYILSSIRALHTLPGDTNIADAWSYGISLLDSTKVNYLFLLTDGLHNNGPTKEELFDRLKTWGSVAKGKYMYAFYVMLTPNAKESEICEIVDATENMWLIESMNLNTSLIKTSISTRKNVFNNHTASLSFLSNNKNADLNNLGLNISIENNGFYDIENISKSPIGDIYSFDIVEKRPKIQMPLDTTLTLHFSYDTLANPFVFLTPDKVDFQIVNQGPRTVSIVVAKNKKGFSDLNLKKLKYKEPFQGFFRWTRELYEPYFDLPFLSKPDTASTVSTLILSWNEEAVRAGSSIKIDLSTGDSEYGDHVIVTNGKLNIPLIAKTGQDTLLLHTKVIPGIPSTQFTGDVWAITDKIDSVNDEELTSNSIKLGSWRLQYKKSWPFWIWLFWVLLTVFVNIAAFFIIKWSIKIILKVLSGFWSGLTEVGRSIGSLLSHKEVKNASSGAPENTDEENDNKEEHETKRYKHIEKLERRYLKARTIHQKSDSLYELMVALEKLKSKSQSSSEEAFENLSGFVKQDLEKLWLKSSGLSSMPRYQYQLPMGKAVHVSTNSGEKVKTLAIVVKEYEKDFNIKLPTTYIYKYGRVDLSTMAIAKVDIDYENTNCDRYKKAGKNGVQEEAAAKLMNDRSFKKRMKKHGYNDIWQFLNGQNERGEFIRETPLLFHEDPNCKTIYVVPTYIHENIDHYGGISMAKIVNILSFAAICTKKSRPAA